MGFVANFIRFPAMQNFENRLRFDKVTKSSKVRNFLEQCGLFTARSTCTYASAILGIVILSVRPSDTRVLCDET